MEPQGTTWDIIAHVGGIILMAMGSVFMLCILAVIALWAAQAIQDRKIEKRRQQRMRDEKMLQDAQEKYRHSKPAKDLEE